MAKTYHFTDAFVCKMLCAAVTVTTFKRLTLKSFCMEKFDACKLIFIALVIFPVQLISNKICKNNRYLVKGVRITISQVNPIARPP